MKFLRPSVLFRYFLSLGLMIGLLYWAFFDQDLSEIWFQLRSISLFWVTIVTLLTLSTLWIRSWRWRIMIRSFASNVRIIDGVWALSICYAANVVIPRSGEFLRAVSLKWTRSAPISPTLATVVVERILDVLWLVFCIGTALFLERKLINQAFPILETLSLLTLIGCSLLLLILIFISYYRSTALKWIEPILNNMGPKIANPVNRILRTFVDGLESLKSPSAHLKITLSSILLNSGYILIIYALFASMGFIENYDLDFTSAIVIMAISSLGVVVPTPGGAGSYHLIFSIALHKIYSVPEPLALACATIAHGLATITYLTIGCPALILQWYFHGRNKYQSAQTINKEPPT
tara:strand:- start:3311 stop:4357 length:1047 start_codon:yes stop_codon:yes gene_type:complete